MSEELDGEKVAEDLARLSKVKMTWSCVLFFFYRVVLSRRRADGDEKNEV